MSDFNIFGQQFNDVNGFRLADTSGTPHNFFSTEAVVSSNLLPENIAEGVVVKVGTIDDDDCIALITGTHQGGASGSGGKQIKFIDYDGEIIEEYTLEEFQALDGMPANPSHVGLIAQGWNWDRQEVFDYLDAMPDWPVVIGQMYVTESGKTEIDIELPADALSPWLLLSKGGSGSLDIDWGDGSIHDIITNSGNAYLNHSYSSAGKYTIKIDVQNATFSFTQGNTYSSDYVGFFRNGINNNRDLKYASTIKAIRLGNGITLLGRVYKFQNLEYITIPSTVTQVSGINDCYNLRGLVISKNTSSQGGIEWATKLKNISFRPLSSNYTVKECTSLNYCTCPSEITQVDSYKFSGCHNLSLPSVLPSSVKYISHYAFQSCFKLTSINLPSSVSRIDQNAFASCANLSSIDIPSTVSSIGSYAFQGCVSLDSIDISAVSTIWPNTFQYCKSLSSVSFSSTLTSIGYYAFGNCSNLSLIDIPSTVSSIGANAFQNCVSLQSISIPSLVKTIWPNTFWYCYSLSSVDIPSTVSSIGPYAFYNNYSLSSINLPSALASIGQCGFCNCQSLTSITIPALTTYIGNQGFLSCTGMQEYHFLPTTPPTIGTSVFNSIPSTCKIYVPYSSDHSILNAYQTKTNWATWSSYMVEESP